MNQTPKKTISVIIPLAMAEEIDAIAKANQTSRGYVVRILLAREIELSALKHEAQA